MTITSEQIKTLRDKTGISVMQCKKALENSDGDIDKAIEDLKKQGTAIAAKKSGRDLGAGTVSAYIHAGGSVGAMIELLCETDFVAKNEEFTELARELAMQAAAMLTDDNVSERETFLKLPYIKDGDKTVADLLQDATQKFGERIEIGRITRYSV